MEMYDHITVFSCSASISRTIYRCGLRGIERVEWSLRVDKFRQLLILNAAEVDHDEYHLPNSGDFGFDGGSIEQIVACTGRSTKLWLIHRVRTSFNGTRARLLGHAELSCGNSPSSILWVCGELGRINRG